MSVPSTTVRPADLPAAFRTIADDARKYTAAEHAAAVN